MQSGEVLLAGVPKGTPLLVYGTDQRAAHAERARELDARGDSLGRSEAAASAKWY